MDEINPIVIPRNHILKDIIKKAVIDQDYSKLHEFLGAIKDPFTSNNKYQQYYTQPQVDERVLNTFCGT